MSQTQAPPLAKPPVVKPAPQPVAVAKPGKQVLSPQEQLNLAQQQRQQLFLLQQQRRRQQHPLQQQQQLQPPPANPALLQMMVQQQALYMQWVQQQQQQAQYRQMLAAAAAAMPFVPSSSSTWPSMAAALAVPTTQQPSSRGRRKSGKVKSQIGVRQQQQQREQQHQQALKRRRLGAARSEPLSPTFHLLRPASPQRTPFVLKGTSSKKRKRGGSSLGHSSPTSLTSSPAPSPISRGRSPSFNRLARTVVSCGAPSHLLGAAAASTPRTFSLTLREFLQCSGVAEPDLTEHVAQTRVGIFRAAADSRKRLLIQASVLARVHDLHTNVVSMYLARRRKEHGGIYQAEAFECKPDPSLGLRGIKKNSYFVTAKVFLQFGRYQLLRGNPMTTGPRGAAPAAKQNRRTRFVAPATVVQRSAHPAPPTQPAPATSPGLPPLERENQGGDNDDKEDIDDDKEDSNDDDDDDDDDDEDNDDDDNDDDDQSTHSSDESQAALDDDPAGKSFGALDMLSAIAMERK